MQLNESPKNFNPFLLHKSHSSEISSHFPWGGSLTKRKTDQHRNWDKTNNPFTILGTSITVFGLNCYFHLIYNVMLGLDNCIQFLLSYAVIHYAFHYIYMKFEK